jgi:hypothetical protein
VSLIIKKYNDLSAVHFFYDGTERLRFSPSKWLWVREQGDKLIELSGVTGVCKIVDRSQPLMRWAVKKSLEKLRILALENHLGPDECVQMFPFELDRLIEEAKKADKEELESAGETGHEAHRWIESLILANLAGTRNRELEILAKLPEDELASNACCGSVEWMVKHNVRFRSTERKVFHREHLYAGTMDGLAIVDSCEDRCCCPTEFKDRLTVVDWKTSNYLYTTYLLQVAAYQAAYECETGDQIEDRWVLRLDKETGDFDPWHAEGRDAFDMDFTAFLHALDLTRSLKLIDGRVGVIREARREVRKAANAAAKLERLALACEGSKRYKGVRIPKCGPTGTGCAACLKKYFEVHGK